MGLIAIILTKRWFVQPIFRRHTVFVSILSYNRLFPKDTFSLYALSSPILHHPSPVANKDKEQWNQVQKKVELRLASENLDFYSYLYEPEKD